MRQRQEGFTLIEILIALAIISLILVAITGTMLDSLRAKNQVVYADKVQQNGSYAIAELRKNIMNAKPDGINCISDSSVQIVNKRNGRTTTLSCNNGDNNIASVSASPVTTVVLTSSDVVVENCSSFVACEPSSPLELRKNKVTFNFTLRAKSDDPKIQTATRKTFSTSISTRY